MQLLGNPIPYMHWNADQEQLTRTLVAGSNRVVPLKACQNQINRTPVAGAIRNF